MNEEIRENNSNQFFEEVKSLLSGVIRDEDTVKYISFKITRLYEQHADTVLESFGDDLK